MEKPNQQLETLPNNYRSEFLPSSTHEDMLVRELAVSDWHLSQVTRIETGLLSFEMHAAYRDLINMGNPPRWVEAFPMACTQCGDVHPNEATGEPEREDPELSETGDEVRTIIMGAAWANNPAAFALLVRYQSQARRACFRALKQLELVRTGKAGCKPESPPPAWANQSRRKFRLLQTKRTHQRRPAKPLPFLRGQRPNEPKRLHLHPPNRALITPPSSLPPKNGVRFSAYTMRIST